MGQHQHTATLATSNMGQHQSTATLTTSNMGPHQHLGGQGQELDVLGRTLDGQWQDHEGWAQHFGGPQGQHHERQGQLQGEFGVETSKRTAILKSNQRQHISQTLTRIDQTSDNKTLQNKCDIPVVQGPSGYQKGQNTTSGYSPRKEHLQHIDQRPGAYGSHRPHITQLTTSRTSESTGKQLGTGKVLPETQHVANMRAETAPVYHVTCVTRKQTLKSLSLSYQNFMATHAHP